MAERGLEHRKGGVVTVVAVGDGEVKRGGCRLRVVEVEDSKFSEA